MLCKNCNHKLPDDSDFCQYCGKQITNDTEIAESADNNEKEAPVDISPEEAVKIMEEIQKATIINALSANKENQPDFEDDADFGLVPQKPIYTLATKSVDGETEYLNKLRTLTGKKISWNRRGSTEVDGVNGMIDIYDIFLPLGGLYKTIYINMYGAKESTKAPTGFILKNSIPSNTPSNSRDNKQKSKQSDNHKSHKKFSIAVIALSIVLLFSLTLNLSLWVSTNEQSSTLEQQKEELEHIKEEYSSLNTEQKIKKSDYYDKMHKVNFYENHIAIVADDGTNYYHKFGCNILYKTSFWIYTINKAEDEGYIPCYKCCD